MNTNETTNTATPTALEPRKWLYVFSGFCGNDSTFIAPYEKTGHQDGGYMCLTDAMEGKPLTTKPMVEEWRCISITGKEFTTSANQFNQKGIGGISSRPNYCPTISWPDAKLLLECGFTKDEVEETFGKDAFLTYDERETADIEKTPSDLTDSMLKMLLALKDKKLALEKAAKEEKDRKFMEARKAYREKYFYLPCKVTEDHKYLRTGEVSRNLREILKREFHGTKFTVRSDSYSGGDSVRVKYEDGPAYKKVNGIVSMFQENHADITGDYWDYDPNAFNCEFGGFSYAHCERDISNGVIDRLCEILIAKGNKDDRDLSYNSNLLRLAHEIAEYTDFLGAEIADIVWNDTDNRYEVVFKAAENPTPTDPNTTKGKGGITITENKAKNGIELRFPTIPNEAVRNELKSHGWRYTRFNRCWYKTASAETLAFAKRIAEAA